ncbi:MAG: hypothetical protein GY787_25335, partial [Alteromonadales bacterium]|nr:hypothetical protein [Alteromonadales bacterium]
MAVVKEVLYYNSFWLKQLQQDDTNVNAVAVYPGGYPYNDLNTFAQQVIGISSFTAGINYGKKNNLTTTYGGTGTGLTVDIISVSGGNITKLKIRNNGSGYSNGETLTIVQTINGVAASGGTITLRVLNSSGSTGVSYNFPGAISIDSNKGNFVVEESRIRGGYNNTQVGLGAKAYLVEEESLQQNRFNSLIYSGIFNSRTGVNDTNQFSIGEDISKSAPPAYGSIQKLHTDDNNLIVLQENKINRALIDKDAIYSAEGNATITSRFQVIGELIPYNGDFGISRNPESFASYGFQRYFTDKDRNSVLRLSRDGLTEISRYGMLDFFRDELTNLPETTDLVIGARQNPYTITSAIPPAPAANITTKNITINEPASVLSDVQKGMQFLINNLEQTINNKTVYVTQVVGQVITLSQSVTIALGDGITLVAPTRGQIVGGYDIHNKNYIVSIQQKPTWAVPLADDVATGENANYKTLAFDELINGWTSFYTYKPTFALSLKNKYYTVKDQNIYEHYAALTGNNRGTFYGDYKKSNIEFVFNQNSSIAKNFLTVNYEGDNGWQVDSFISDAQRFDYGSQNPLANYQSTNDTAPIVQSYYGGAYDSQGNTYATAVLVPPVFRYGFDRKENKYYAVLKNNSAAT